MTDFTEIKKTSERLLKDHYDFLKTVSAFELIDCNLMPATKLALISYFRSFDLVKEMIGLENVMAFNESAGFTSEYKDAMQ